ncbi:hypothetical protein ES703_66028 [subsurface metagenome]
MVEKANFKMYTLKTYVLIIGGGSAGCMAAIAARDADPGLDVTILEKANIRRSGTLAIVMDVLNVVAVPGVSIPEDNHLYFLHSFRSNSDTQPPNPIPAALYLICFCSSETIAFQDS